MKHAFILGGGPSLTSFQGYDETSPVIACNDAAFRAPVTPDIHFAVDRPYWQANKPHSGSRGLWVRPHGDPWDSRFPDGLDFVWRTGDLWDTENVGDRLACGGGSGPAAVNLAVMLYEVECVTLVGFDGGGVYDRINKSLEEIGKRVRLDYA